MINKITVESVSAKLAKENQSEIRAIRVHNKIAQVLQKFAGKKLTARVATAITNATGWSVQWDCGMVMTEVRVWGGDSGLTVHDDVRFALCYPNQNTGSYDPALFEEYDARHGSAARARTQQRNAIILNAGMLEAYVSAVNETLVKLDAITHFLGLDSMPSDLRYDAKHLIEEAVKHI